ncbi:MAG: hypothetical protein MUE82_08995 [Chloroflexi bacterium]|nr:hypothetical protein [Chloroflexota bacterium]
MSRRRGVVQGLRAAIPLVAVLVLAVAACSEAGTSADGTPPLDVPDASWVDVEDASTAPPVLPTPEPTAPARAVELHKAVAAKEVSLSATGDGLERLELTITSKAKEPIRVVVNPGTVFDAKSSATQAMVVTAKEVVPLEPGASEDVTLEVACSEMAKDQPGSDDTFRLVKRALPKDLTRLLALEDFPNQDFRIQQFAIWTILDDPAPARFVRLGTMGVGTGPSAEEIAAIRDLFVAAGIDPRDYRATR